MLECQHMAFLIIGGRSSSRQRKIQEIYQKLKSQKIQNDPDTAILESQTSIGIEEVRNLKRFLSLKPYSKPPKVAIIWEAQNLTTEAQAALGKIIEEPPGETVIILSSPNQELLLPIIVSRCQVIVLAPESEIALSKEEIKFYQAELETILKSSAGERIKFSGKFKTRQEAEEFCQIQLVLWREMLLENPKIEISLVIRQIQKTQKYLKANVNYRLSLENLLLSYPHKSLSSESS